MLKLINSFGCQALAISKAKDFLQGYQPSTSACYLQRIEQKSTRQKSTRQISTQPPPWSYLRCQVHFSFFCFKKTFYSNKGKVATSHFPTMEFPTLNFPTTILFSLKPKIKIKIVTIFKVTKSEFSILHFVTFIKVISLL